MSFTEAVRTALSQYATFTGRARRSEYWWFVLFTVLVNIATSIIDAVLGSGTASGFGVVSTLASLALLLPSLAVLVRRLHDTGRSGWWVLIGLVPLAGAIVLIVFAVQDSQPAPNQYGPPPKGPAQYGAPGSGWPQPQP
ncbi:MAG: DUF805 domain-containing protein [Actinomycetes bacterium]